MYDLRLVEAWCPAQADGELRELTVGEVLREAAARWPSATALQEIDGEGRSGRQWTYASLLADAERLATALSTRYAPGERIVLWAPNAPEWVLIEYAAAFAGLTLVTANPGYQLRELRYVAEQSRAAGLFFVSAFRGNPMARIAGEAAKTVPGLRELVDIEDPVALFACPGKPGRLPTVASEQAAQIQYTSGTTGLPKGVLLHHRGLTDNARHGYSRAGITAGERMLMFMPLFHTAGCAMAVLGCAQAGARLLLARQFDAGIMNAVIERERVDTFLGVPTMLIAMNAAARERPRDFTSVRLVGCGGSMVAPELVRATREGFGCDFYTVYGQTEASPLIAQTRPDDLLDDICDTVGQAMPLTEIVIRAPGTGSIAAPGETGEICVRGPGIMLGYNDDPAATAEAVDVDGWLRTGDLGAMDDRGFVRITGRVKDIIIRGGENLFPAEIENVLLEHSDVAECAVVGIPDALLGEAVLAYVKPREGAGFDPAALFAHCRARIAAQKTPAHWREIQDWPLTGSGKIQKYVLRERWVRSL
jgi:fatty-acyl-CoA synthase